MKLWMLCYGVSLLLLAAPVSAQDFMVGDVSPLVSASGDLNGDTDTDDAGEFGNDSLSTTDLIIALRAVTNLPGWRPPACSDRFDAIDSSPADTDSTVGGSGTLTTTDLIITLRRVTGIDTSRPRRSAGIGRRFCGSTDVTYLLFPFVAYTGDGFYDTGIAISNTGSDPASIGTVGSTGAVTLYFFRSNADPDPAPVTIAAGLQPGDTATYAVSQLGQPFSGYVFAIGNFPFGHGFAFLLNPAPGTGGAFAHAYQPAVVTNPRLGGVPPPTERVGH